MEIKSHVALFYPPTVMKSYPFRRISDAKTSLQPSVGFTRYFFFRGL